MKTGSTSSDPDLVLHWGVFTEPAIVARVVLLAISVSTCNFQWFCSETCGVDHSLKCWFGFHFWNWDFVYNWLLDSGSN